MSDGEGIAILTAPGHLLVRLPNPLGDAVLATPALRALRRALPGTHIAWAGKRAPLAALDGLGDRDAVMPVGEKDGRTWRRLGFDTVLLLTHSWSTGLAAWHSGARRRIGSGLAGRGVLLTDVVPLPMLDSGLAPRPMPAMYLDLARPFGVVPDGEPPRVVATPYDSRRAKARLAGRRGPVLALNPGAAFGPSKVYPPELLGRVVALVRERVPDVVPLVLGGPGEEDLVDRVRRAVGESALSTHRDPPDLGELKGLLAASAALLTADAGPRHLAEALGVPTVVTMGPTDPRWTGHSRARVVRREDLSCLGCHHRVCPIEHPCLSALEPERVAAAVVAALGREA